jgi:hypothetical protein
MPIKTDPIEFDLHFDQKESADRAAAREAPVPAGGHAHTKRGDAWLHARPADDVSETRTVVMVRYGRGATRVVQPGCIRDERSSLVLLRRDGATVRVEFYEGRSTPEG